MIPVLITACFIFCGISLWFYHQNKQATAAVFKTAASLTFVALACHLQLYETHIWFFFGLLLCLLGDVFLTASGKGKAFVFGLLSFLAAHLFYLAAFIGLGIDIHALQVAAAIIIILMLILARWLLTDMSSTHQRLVCSYLLVIAAMLATAWGSKVNTQAHYMMGFGASIFAISDVFVARHRFKQSALINRLLGLPLYYLAQTLLILGFYKVL